MKYKIIFYQAGLGTGGATRSNLKIANGLAKCGFDVELVHGYAGEDAKSLIPNNISSINLGNSSAIKGLFPLIRYIKKNKPKIIISAALQNNIVVSVARVLSGVKFKLVLTDRVAPTLEIKNRKNFIYKILPYLMRYFYPKADKIIAVSKGNAEDVLTIVPKASNLMQVIYNPAVTEEKLDKGNMEETHIWFDQKVPLIVGLGRLTRQKDFVTLIRAFAKVQEKIDSRLLIIGEGEEREALERLIKELNLLDKIELTGFKPNPYPYLKRADLFVLSSAWEGLPNVLLEAMAFGTSVVSTDCKSGPDEILEGGTVAPLVPVADVEAMAAEMINVLNNPQDSKKLKNRANMFNEEQSIKQYKELIKKVLSE